MIDDLLAFKGRCDAVLERALGRGDMFVHALKDGFEHAVNVRQVRCCVFVLMGLCLVSRGAGQTECVLLLTPQQNHRTAPRSCWPSTWTRS